MSLTAFYTRGPFPLGVILPLSFLFAIGGGIAAPLTLKSPQEGNHSEFGKSVGYINDINGNGSLELFVSGESEHSETGVPDVGRVHFFDSRSGELVKTLEAPVPVEDLGFGWAVTPFVDINSNGFQEIAISTANHPTLPFFGNGTVYLFDTYSGELLRTMDSPHPDHKSHFGWGITVIEDLNNDSIPEIAIGSPGDNPNQNVTDQGTVQIFDGFTAELITILETRPYGSFPRFGGSIQNFQDITGDQVPEILIGSQDSSSSGGEEVGRGLIFNGKTLELIKSIDCPCGMYDHNPRSGGRVFPDINGNGVEELAFHFDERTTPDPPNNPGNLLIVDGSTEEVLKLLTSPTPHFGGAFGGLYSALPDISGDGFFDLAVGAWGEDYRNTIDGGGRVHLLDGRTFDPLGTLFSPYPKTNGQFGIRVKGLPDLDGDTKPELAVSAFYEGTEEPFDTRGLVHVFSSKPDLFVQPRNLEFRPWPISAGPTLGQFVKLENLSLSDLNFVCPEVELVGPDPEDFQLYAFEWTCVTGASGNRLNPGDARQVQVVFDPVTAGTKTALLRIHSDDADEPIIEVPVSGVAFEFTPTPTLTPTETFTPSSTPTPSHTPTMQYDIMPPTGDGWVDGMDLNAWVSILSDGPYDPTLLFDFSLHWGQNIPPVSATATYRVTFQTLWSPETHPTDYPANDHFSRLVGSVHNHEVSFWDIGGFASPGIRDMAERGITSVLVTHVSSAIGDGNAQSFLLGEGVDPVPGSVSLDFEVSLDYPLVTLVSMIAPSPDWFVGVSGFSLFHHGDWVDLITVSLQPYDAGTDSGGTYRSSDDRTSPMERISEIVGFPLIHEGSVAPLGTFTFERIE